MYILFNYGLFKKLLIFKKIDKNEYKMFFFVGLSMGNNCSKHPKVIPNIYCSTNNHGNIGYLSFLSKKSTATQIEKIGDINEFVENSNKHYQYNWIAGSICPKKIREI